MEHEQAALEGKLADCVDKDCLWVLDGNQVRLEKRCREPIVFGAPVESGGKGEVEVSCSPYFLLSDGSNSLRVGGAYLGGIHDKSLGPFRYEEKHRSIWGSTGTGTPRRLMR